MSRADLRRPGDILVERLRAPPELPPREQRAYERARRLEWLSLGWILFMGVALFLLMGSSQTMKTAWLEKVLGLVPPAAFLVASRIAHRRPDQRFPFGYQRAVGIAFLLAGFALFALGCFLLVDGALALARGETAEIGAVEVLGRSIWLGWPMIGAMLASAAVSFLLGHAKLPLSRCLHDKGLHTDAVMNRADWETDVAAAVGIVAIGAGWAWADAAAAVLISIDIVLEGRKNLGQAVEDLADHAPRTLDRARPDPLCADVQRFVDGLPWVLHAWLRLREQGRFLIGEAWVVPRRGAENLPDLVETAQLELRGLHWRIQEIVLVLAAPANAHSAACDRVRWSLPTGNAPASDDVAWTPSARDGDEQHHQEDDQEQPEEDLRDVRRSSRDPGETKGRSHQGDDQEDQGPTQHGGPP